MITTEERRATLARERGRLSKAIRKPWLSGYIRDKRIIVDALEALITLDLKEKKNEEAKKTKGL